MAWLTAIEASPVFDVDLGLLALLSRVPFFEAVRARNDCLAASRPLPLGSGSAFVSVLFLIEELASDEGAHFLVVRRADPDKGTEFGPERRVSLVKTVVPFIAL